jgi:integrase
MEALGRVELPTFGLGNRCSIHLSYRAAFEINSLKAYVDLCYTFAAQYGILRTFKRSGLMGKIQKGRLYERSGAFYVQYRITIDGKRVQRSHRLAFKERDGKFSSLSSKALKIERDRFMLTVNQEQMADRSNEPTLPRDMPVADFWEQTYLPFIEKNKRARTVTGYKRIWNAHLKKHFGDSTLRNYSTGQGTNYITSISAQYSRHTLQHIRALGSAIFSHAIATEVLGSGALQVNPWGGVRNLAKPKETSCTPHYTLTEIQAILLALGECRVQHANTKENGYGRTPLVHAVEVHGHPEAQLLMSLTFFCGLRPSEAIGLDWSDFDAGTVHVQRAVVNGVVGPTKTPDSVAKIQLIEPIVSLLKAWHVLLGSPMTGWVFAGERSEKPLNIPNLVNRVIRPCLKEHRLEWKGLYAGRRGAATMLVDLTKGLVAAQELLRHKSMTTTADFYKKQTQNALPEGLKLLEAAAIANN